MGYYCAAYGCSNNTKTADKDISYHKIPQNPKLKSKWKYAIRWKAWETTNRRICSKHFSEEDFRKNLYRKFLKSDAIPSNDLGKKKKSKLELKEIQDLEEVIGFDHSPSLLDQEEDEVVVYPNKPKRKTFEEHNYSYMKNTNAVGTSECEEEIPKVPSGEDVPLLDAPSFVKLPPNHLEKPKRKPIHDHTYSYKNDINAIKKECDYLRTNLLKVLFREKMFKGKIKRTLRANTKLKKMVDDLQYESVMHKEATFNQDKFKVSGLQLSLIRGLTSNKPRTSTYSKEMIEFSRTLYSLSPKAYEFVRKTFTLPGRSTLKKAAPPVENGKSS